MRELWKRHPEFTGKQVIEKLKQGRTHQIAGEMGITENTVKVHRSNMMRKIQAASFAGLCRIVDTLKLLPENSRRS
jgi:FixJ family two-component response regulator